MEGLPNGILFWRSFTHWIGGMGVLVFLLSLLPLTGGSHVNLMKAESPGPQVDKLVPKVQSTAKILYGIYFALTVVEVCFLLAGGMNAFDSLLTAFGTAGTGGFGFKNDSFASFSPYIQWVVTVFMILFGVNFNAYFLLLLRRFRRAASSEEVRAYFAIILAAVAVITVNIRSLYGTFGEALRHAAFQVGSIITTTGFSSCDFDLWPTLAKEVLVLLMFVGACAGSTGGGIKVSRFLLMGKTLGKELKQALHPQVVPRPDGRKLVNHETIRTTNVFLAAYIFIFAASFMLVSLDGFDMVTNFTSIAATLNNIGPGLNQVGPMMNFGAYSNLQSWCSSLICWPVVWKFSRCWCSSCPMRGEDSKSFITQNPPVQPGDFCLDQNVRSTFSCARYCRASSSESSSRRRLPERSAMVRATRRMRSWARAERPSVS